jgi:hypothetical protein
VEWTITIHADRADYDKVKQAVDAAHAALRKCCRDVTLRESPVV